MKRQAATKHAATFALSLCVEEDIVLDKLEPKGYGRTERGYVVPVPVLDRAGPVRLDKPAAKPMGNHTPPFGARC